MDELLEEKEWLRRCADGDRKAFALLYTRYLGKLLHYLYLFNRSKEDNEEIVQEVFIRIWEIRETLPEVVSFRAFLYRIAKNRLLDHLKRLRAESGALAFVTPGSEDSGQRIDDDLCYEQYYEVACEAIGKLTDKRRQIFEMRTKEGLSLDEISDRLHISKTVVKKQFYAASGFVREYLRSRGVATTVEVLGYIVLVASA